MGTINDARQVTVIIVEHTTWDGNRILQFVQAYRTLPGGHVGLKRTVLRQY